MRPSVPLSATSWFVILALFSGCESKPDSGVLDLDGSLIVRVVDGTQSAPVEGALVEIAAIGKPTGPEPADTNEDGLVAVAPPKAKRMISVNADGFAPNRQKSPQTTGFVEVRAAPTEQFSVSLGKRKQSRSADLRTLRGTEIEFASPPRRSENRDLRNPVVTVSDPNPRDSRDLLGIPNELETVARPGTGNGRLDPDHVVWIDVRDAADFEERGDGRIERPIEDEFGSDETRIEREPVTRRPTNVANIDIEVRAPVPARALSDGDVPPTVFHYDEAQDAWVATDLPAEEVPMDGSTNEVHYAIDKPGWWAVGWERTEFTCVRGCVADASGKPASGAQLTLLATGNDADSTVAYTDADGCFAADVQPASEYVVLAGSVDGETFARIEDTGAAGPRVADGVGSCHEVDDLTLRARDVQEALCAAGADQCGDSCVDLTRSEDHCGRCDQSCTGDEICLGGVCLEPSEDQIRTDCEAGTAGPLCEPCQAGSYCPGGRAAPLRCNSNDWDHDQDPATACVDHSTCEPGERVATVGTATRDVQCAACPSGAFSTGENADECTQWSPCPAGEVEVSGGTAQIDRECAPCEAGSYCAGGGADPVACANGHWDHDGDPATECVAHRVCTSGQRLVEAGTATTNTRCAACSTGTFSTGQNSESCTAWRDCVPGQFVSLEGTAQADRACEPCDEGLTSITMNAAQCVQPGQCQAGQVQIAPATPTTDAVCAGCSTGQFCPGGADPAISCGTYDWDHDSNPATACQPWTDCVAGQYVVSNGSSVSDRICDTCSGGTFTDTTNAASCSDHATCDPGEYVESQPDIDANRLCMACDGGFSTTSNASSCTAYQSCAAGDYIDVPGTGTSDRSCATCPSGFTTTEADSARCGIPFDQVSVDDTTFCAIRSDNGRPLCWGGNTFGVASDAPDVALVQVSTSGSHTCGIVAGSAEVVCWGNDSNGQCSGAPAATAFSQVIADNAYSCGVLAGARTLDCWGIVPAGLPTDVAVQDFDTYSTRGCLIRADNSRLLCWGNDSTGFVSEAPTDVAMGAVSAGSNFACAIRDADGRLVCWGDDARSALPAAMQDVAFDAVHASFYGGCAQRADNGRLMCWDASDASTATLEVPTDRSFEQVDLDLGWGCGLDAGNLLRCWGGDDRSYVRAGEPRPGQYTDVAMGAYSYCVRSVGDDGFECFGSNGAGQLELDPSVDYTKLALTNSTTCGIRADNSRIDCVGANLGTGFPDTEEFFDIAAGADHVCALKTFDNHIVCWGSDTFGHGIISDAPTDVEFSAVAANGYMTCAIRSDDGQALCWGLQHDGVEASQSKDLVEVVVGGLHACGRDDRNDVTCWGPRNDNGEQDPPGGAENSKISALSAGYEYTCGIRESDDMPVCWGTDVLAQTRSAPSGTPLARIAAGGDVTCGIRSSDGNLTCWGRQLLNPL